MLVENFFPVLAPGLHTELCDRKPQYLLQGHLTSGNVSLSKISAGQFEPLALTLVEASGGNDSALWTEWMDRYHYLGYRVPVGAQLRYLVHSPRCAGPVLACLLWSSPAWKMAARDHWPMTSTFYPTCASEPANGRGAVSHSLDSDSSAFKRATPKAGTVPTSTALVSSPLASTSVT